jgi:hypothetical protein
MFVKTDSIKLKKCQPKQLIEASQAAKMLSTYTILDCHSYH